MTVVTEQHTSTTTPAESAPSRTSSRLSYLGSGVSVALIAVTVLSLQFLGGAYSRDIADDPDEPAHFVTGMMVYDYLTTGLSRSPMAFAEEYYVRYPKVAFGHWPPVFYLLQAGWYLLWGGNKVSATLLMGAVTVCLAYILFRRVAGTCGSLIASLAVAAFLTLPLVRNYSSVLMADMLVCLLCTLSVFSFSDFLRTSAWKPLLGSLFWMCVAILTKGNGFALFPLMVLGPLVAGCRDRAIWSKILAVIGAGLAVTLPFYMVAGATGLDFHVDPYNLLLLAFAAHYRLFVVPQLFSIASPVMYVFAAWAFFRFWQERRRASGITNYDVPIAATWLLCVTLFHIICPISGPARYFLPVTPALALLFAHGLRCLSEQRPSATFSKLAPLAATLLAIITALGDGLLRNEGYAAVAQSIPSGEDEPIVLVSSDSTGEGAFIVERLLRDASRRGVALRASKVLSESDWFGGDYKLHLQTTQEVATYLRQTPVHYVVLDEAAFAQDTPPHHELLREVVSNQADFAEVGRHKVIRDGQEAGSSVVVYRNRRPEPARFVEIDMQGTLGRSLVLHLEPGREASIQQ